MAQIANLIRSGIRERLSDETTGFNSAVVASAAEYDVSQPEKLYLDFGPALHGFIEGNLAPDDLDDTSPSKYPYGFLYVVSTANENLRKFAEFSGTVTVAFDYWLSWSNQKALRDFEKFGDLIEDVLFSIMQTTDWHQWAPGAVYNGNAKLSRGPVESDGANWRQRLAFEFIFEYDA